MALGQTICIIQMVDVLGTTWVEVVGFERIAVSLSSGSRTSSSESFFESTGLAALYVFNHVARANLSAIHPCESTLGSGTWLCTGYVLCAEISYTLN